MAKMNFLSLIRGLKVLEIFFQCYSYLSPLDTYLTQEFQVAIS